MVDKDVKDAIDKLSSMARNLNELDEKTRQQILNGLKKINETEKQQEEKTNISQKQKEKYSETVIQEKQKSIKKSSSWETLQDILSEVPTEKVIPFLRPSRGYFDNLPVDVKLKPITAKTQMELTNFIKSLASDPTNFVFDKKTKQILDFSPSGYYKFEKKLISSIFDLPHKNIPYFDILTALIYIINDMLLPEEKYIIQERDGEKKKYYVAFEKSVIYYVNDKELRKFLNKFETDYLKLNYNKEYKAIEYIFTISNKKIKGFFKFNFENHRKYISNLILLDEYLKESLFDENMTPIPNNIFQRAYNHPLMSKFLMKLGQMAMTIDLEFGIKSIPAIEVVKNSDIEPEILEFDPITVLQKYFFRSDIFTI